jgi:hypothetical protein
MSGISKKPAFCVEPSSLACEQFVERRDERGGLLVPDLVVDGLKVTEPPL